MTALVRDPAFFELLWLVDSDLADEVEAKGCPHCGGKLHRADFPRRPRGGPCGLDEKLSRRRSFCCSVEGCRRRVTPPSVRFMGRRQYWGVLVLLASTVSQGLSHQRVRRCKEVFGVSRQTLRRWRHWWTETLPKSRFWQLVRGDFVLMDTDELPFSLLECFGRGREAWEQVVLTLKCLSSASSREHQI